MILTFSVYISVQLNTRHNVAFQDTLKVNSSYEAVVIKAGFIGAERQSDYELTR